MIDRTANGRAFKILTIIDEYTRECLGLVVKRRITSQEVIDKLFDLFILRGIPEHIRSDNGPEFTAKAIRKWLNRIGVKTLFIEPDINKSFDLKGGTVIGGRSSSLSTRVRRDIIRVKSFK